MGKTFGNEYLVPVIGGKMRAARVSEGWRAAPNIQHHVEYMPGDHINQLALGMFQLIVKSPEGSLTRMGMVVLYEHGFDSFFAIFDPMIGFKKKTAVVFEDNRLNENDFGNG
jgi:hypothetical protein